MNSENIDQRLQDYLDDRMTLEERTAFEGTLRNDPDLAERVRAALQLREIVAETPVDLPPGFHARTRARFEKSRGTRSPIRSIISWEAAGLAAATILLAAVLVPYIMQDGFLAPAPDMAEDVLEDHGRSEAGPSDEAAPADRDETTAAVAGDKGGETAPTLEKRMKKSRGGTVGGVAAEKSTDFHSEYEARAENGKMRAAAAPAPSEIQADRRFYEEKDEGKAPPVAMAARKEESLDFPGEAVPGPTLPATAYVRLPDFSLGENSITTIKNDSDWREMMTQPGLDLAERLEPDFEYDRVILLGKRENPFRCETTRFSIDSGVTLIILGNGTRETEYGGCALLLPKGPEPVVIILDNE